MWHPALLGPSPPNSDSNDDVTETIGPSQLRRQDVLLSGLRALVTDCDGGEVTDSEVDACHPVAGGIGVLDFDVADEVSFPPVAVPDRPDLPDVLYVYVRVGGVFTENEATPSVFQFSALRESNPGLVGVVLEAVLFEDDRRAPRNSQRRSGSHRERL